MEIVYMITTSVSKCVDSNDFNYLNCINSVKCMIEAQMNKQGPILMIVQHINTFFAVEIIFGIHYITINISNSNDFRHY